YCQSFPTNWQLINFLIRLLVRLRRLPGCPPCIDSLGSLLSNVVTSHDYDSDCLTPSRAVYVRFVILCFLSHGAPGTDRLTTLVNFILIFISRARVRSDQTPRIHRALVLVSFCRIVNILCAIVTWVRESSSFDQVGSIYHTSINSSSAVNNHGNALS
ncbi:Uncharacterized protein FWK35_00033433, partial [Aphis craccivora]